MSSNKVRCAIIGSGGYWSKNIIRCLLENDDVDISVLCDLNEKRLLEVAKKFRLYGKSVLTTEYRDIKSNEIDAVFVCTPAVTHAEIAKHFLNMGKHTFVEKPLAMNVVDALELNQIVDSYSSKQYIENNKPISIKLCVGHTFLYNPYILKIKELIERDKILYISSRRLNMGRVQIDNNVLFSLSPHDISIANFLMGDMPEKDGFTVSGHCFVQKDVEDVVFLTLKYPDNRVANIHVSWLDPVKTRDLTVVTDKKMVYFDDVTSELRVYDNGVDYIPPEGEKAYGIRLRVGDVHIPKVKNTEPLKEEINHFIDCILNDKLVFTDGLQGLDVVSILEAAQKSMKSQKSL